MTSAQREAISLCICLPRIMCRINNDVKVQAVWIPDVLPSTAAPLQVVPHRQLHLHHALHHRHLLRHRHMGDALPLHLTADSCNRQRQALVAAPTRHVRLHRHPRGHTGDAELHFCGGVAPTPCCATSPVSSRAGLTFSISVLMHSTIWSLQTLSGTHDQRGVCSETQATLAAANSPFADAWVCAYNNNRLSMKCLLRPAWAHMTRHMLRPHTRVFPRCRSPLGLTS